MECDETPASLFGAADFARTCGSFSVECITSSRRSILTSRRRSTGIFWYFRVSACRALSVHLLLIIVDQIAGLQLAQERRNFIYGFGGEPRKIENSMLAIGE